MPFCIILLGFCITRAAVDDMCPLNSFSLDCVPNTLTASICQCDHGFIQSNSPPDDLSSGSGGTESGFGGIESGSGGEESRSGGAERGFGSTESGSGGAERGFGGEESGSGGTERGFGGAESGSGGEESGCGGLNNLNFSGCVGKPCATSEKEIIWGF